MNNQLEALLVDAKAWLSDQPAAESDTDRWYALGNFRSFIEAIDRDGSVQSIEKAVHSLRHHISDQLDWSANYCKEISMFCEQADRIRKQAKNV